MSEFAGLIPVGQGHALHVQVFGPEHGPAAVFLHGGPGSGCGPLHRTLFPDDMRVVLIDQRGAGRSTPARSRADNTTPHLINDLETIRRHFGITNWLVVGGSWGATLALAYALEHRTRVRGLVLRSVFLGTRAELEAVFLHTLPRFHPDLWTDVQALFPGAEDLLGTWWARILDPDPAVHRPAALAWHDTERILSRIDPPVARLDPGRLNDPAVPLPATPFMEAHYFSNDCFLSPILPRAAELAGLPGLIVQARYDLLCPPAVSRALAAAWGVRVIPVPRAGHDMGDGTTMDVLRRAIVQLGR